MTLEIGWHVLLNAQGLAQEHVMAAGTEVPRANQEHLCGAMPPTCTATSECSSKRWTRHRPSPPTADPLGVATPCSRIGGRATVVEDVNVVVKVVEVSVNVLFHGRKMSVFTMTSRSRCKRSSRGGAERIRRKRKRAMYERASAPWAEHQRCGTEKHIMGSHFLRMRTSTF